MVTKFDNDLLGFFLNCNGCSISCVIKASAKSQMLLVRKHQSTSYVYISSFSIIFLLWILHVLPCKLFFFFLLMNIKRFCNGAQEMSLETLQVSVCLEDFWCIYSIKLLSAVPPLWPYTFYYNEFCSFAHFFFLKKKSLTVREFYLNTHYLQCLKNGHYTPETGNQCCSKFSTANED